MPGNNGLCAPRGSNGAFTTPQTHLFRILTIQLTWSHCKLPNLSVRLTVIWNENWNPSAEERIVCLDSVPSVLCSPGTATRAPFEKGIEHVANTGLWGRLPPRPRSNTYTMPAVLPVYLRSQPQLSASQSSQWLFTFRIHETSKSTLGATFSRWVGGWLISYLCQICHKGTCFFSFLSVAWINIAKILFKILN